MSQENLSFPNFSLTKLCCSQSHVHNSFLEAVLKDLHRSEARVLLEAWQTCLFCLSTKQTVMYLLHGFLLKILLKVGGTPRTGIKASKRIKELRHSLTILG